ncbi:MAG: hypothetical protein KIT59_00915 [Nitrosomonas sp.]|nr:hypothetical protein [Nitrosomonas sp.]
MNNPWEMLAGITKPPHIKINNQKLTKAQQIVKMAERGIIDSKDIARALNTTEQYVRTILVPKKLLNDKRLLGRKVGCFDENGNCIKRYNAITEASLDVGRDDSSIHNAIKNGWKSAGYYWRKAND